MRAGGRAKKVDNAQLTLMNSACGHLSRLMLRVCGATAALPFWPACVEALDQIG